MKKIYLLLAALLVFVAASAQVTVTVTNPTNTTPNLAASYASLANAVTAVNAITAMSGPVTLTCGAGNETAPAGGYSITSPGGTSATNTITFTTSGTVTITASASLTAGSFTDALFKLIGADYITISGFTMKENAANTTTTAASNNMTEWGIALLYASTTNGSQNNTIQNNTITLDRTYSNSFGIYSNTRHSATNTTTTADISNNTTAPNSNNKFYGNTISNVNCGIAMIGSGVSANQDFNNDIGGSSVTTGNTITNWGADGPTTWFVAGPSAGISGIFVNNQSNENVSYNTLVSATINFISGSYASGIDKEYLSSQPVGTITSAITHNTITLSDSSTGGFIYVSAIICGGITGLSTATLNINDNVILNCAETRVLSTAGFWGIRNTSAAGVVNMNNNIIKGTTSIAPNVSFIGLFNGGAVITTLNINNNQLGVAGSGFMSSNAAGGNKGVYGIWNGNAAITSTVNINGNSIDGISSQDCSIYGIRNEPFLFVTLAPAFININNNQFGSVTGTFASFSAVQTNSNMVTGIYNNGGDAATNLQIQNNDFRGIVHTVTGNCSEYFIINNASLLSSNISGNTFTNLNINNSGVICFIFNSDNMPSGASFTCNNNQIVGSFSKTAAGPSGQVLFLLSQGNSVSGSTITETGNNFSNVTINGGGFVGWDEQSGISATNGPAKTITGNTFSNIAHTGSAYQTVPVSLEYGTTTNFSSNTIFNISSPVAIYGLQFFSAIPQVGGSCTISSNIISGLSSTGGNVEAIFGGWSAANNSYVNVNIQDNTISNLSSTSSSGLISAIDAGGVTTNISGNVISGLNGSGTGSPSASGIIIRGGTTINVYRNDIHSITESGTVSTTSPAVNGMLFPTATTVNAYNNFISDLKATNASLADAVRGISVTSTTASSTYNLYYNSIYLNTTSTGTNFGTSGIYHTTNATASTAALNLIDNIIVNTSTPNGTGITTAFRRSDGTLANYASASDFNLFYAGTPSASRLIYYDGTNSDQTLATYETRVSPRDANSVSYMPNFASTTDLHLSATGCNPDGAGTPVAGITTDVDGQTRNVSTPDIGADEFTSTYIPALAGVAGNSVCDNKNVSAGGTTYMSSCDLIAKVFPSGGAAVTGNINTCVTLDNMAGALPTFNAEPYLTRHYDIEPVTANNTTTSATITLYFTQAEFDNYNAKNGVWPDLPTGPGDAAGKANLKITQYHGTPLTTPSQPGMYTYNGGNGVLIDPNDANIVWNGSYWAVTFDITGFSGFYVHTNFYYPLPISLNYFRGTKQGGIHLLDWKVTCNSMPRATMVLERSGNSGGPFTAINSITADAVRCNQPFNYTDAQPLKGMNYYRLKMVDANGKVSYSNIVALLNAVKGTELVSIAPNPVTSDGAFKLNIASAQATKIDLVISDMMGRIVLREQRTLIAGFNSLDMNVANLAPGTYTIRSITPDDRTGVIRFVKQ